MALSFPISEICPLLNLGGQICYEIVRKIDNLVVPRSKLNTLRKILKIAAPFNQN